MFFLSLKRTNNGRMLLWNSWLLLSKEQSVFTECQGKKKARFPVSSKQSMSWWDEQIWAQLPQFSLMIYSTASYYLPVKLLLHSHASIQNKEAPRHIKPKVLPELLHTLAHTFSKGLEADCRSISGGDNDKLVTRSLMDPLTTLHFPWLSWCIRTIRRSKWRGHFPSVTPAWWTLDLEEIVMAWWVAQ